MPLLDHFHPPLSDSISWEGIHGQWPAMLVLDLNRLLPSAYRAAPKVHIGAGLEIDIAALERNPELASHRPAESSGGGVATAVYSPPEPSLSVEVALPDQDQFEVKVYDNQHNILLAAIEIVSPANKDRPGNRSAFAVKCASLLQQGVTVSIIDVVTTRNSNLYLEMLDLVGGEDSSFQPDTPNLYATSSRYHRDGGVWKLESWARILRIGQPLPTLPLWLASDLAVPIEFEKTYIETCQALRIV